MNVLYFYQYFTTREGLAGTRCYEFSVHLVSQGHHVTVVTGGNEHAEEPCHRLVERRWVDGIQVIRLGIPYSQMLGRMGRVTSFLQFAGLASLVAPWTKKPDVVVATSTPLTVGIPGLLAARWFRVPLVFEVRDLWPAIPIALGFLRDPVSIAASRALERLLYREADALIALSPGMERGMVAQGAPAQRIRMIPNMADLSLFRWQAETGLPSWRATVGLPADAFVVVHVGAMGFANDLGQALDAAKLLSGTGIFIALVGKGSELEKLQGRATAEELENVVFAGPYPRKAIPWVLAEADAGLLCFRRNPVLYHNSANKFGDYLAAGLPVVVTYPGWQAKLIERYGAGIVVTGDPSELAGALMDLRHDRARREAMQAGALRLATDRLNRDQLVKQFEEVLLAVTGTVTG